MTTTYLLFSNLPFVFDTDLPLNLGRGVFLCSPDPAREGLREHDEMFSRGRSEALVLPEEVAGLHEIHVCLKRQHPAFYTIDRARNDLWYALLSLRLARPVGFRTGGFATIEDDGPPTIERLDLQGNGTPPGAGHFGSSEVGNAAAINRRIRDLTGNELERIRSAINFYSHCSTGLISSWQLGLLGLLAALECIFPQPRNDAVKNRLGHGDETYGERLGRRVGTFLPRHVRPPGLARWIARNYSTFRNKIAHGFHAAPTRVNSRSENLNRYRKLNEIVRLTLLGAIGETNTRIATNWPRSAQGVIAQRRLEALGTSNSKFLAAQKYWSPSPRPGNGNDAL